MKTKSTKRNVDPKLHVRKKTAGMASGAILGATVAGPIGALVGGAIGTFIGDAAEEGARLPKPVTNRLKKTSLRSLTRGKTSGKRSVSRMKTKTTSAPRSKRAAASRTKKKK